MKTSSVGRNFIHNLTACVAQIQQQGGAVTRQQFEHLVSLEELLPQGGIGNFSRKYLRNALQEVKSDDLRVTATLVTTLEFIKQNHKDHFVSASLDEASHILTSITQSFENAAASSSSVTSLFAPRSPQPLRGLRPQGAVPLVRVLDRYFQTLPLPDFPDDLVLQGVQIQGKTDPNLPELLKKAFKVDVDVETFQRSLYLEFKNKDAAYRISHLSVREDSSGAIVIYGQVFSDKEKKVIGTFDIEIPEKKNGELWVARGRHFALEKNDQNQGIMESLLRSQLWFLQRLGLEAMDVLARNLEQPDEPSNSWGYFARLGFNAKREDFFPLKERFIEFLRGRGLLTPDVERDIRGMQNIWQISEYVIENEPVGKYFMAQHFREPISLRFTLAERYTGWIRISPKKYPLELDGLFEETRDYLLSHWEQFPGVRDEIMISYDRLGHYLADWIRNNAQEILSRRNSARKTMMRVADILNLVQHRNEDDFEIFFHRHFPGESFDPEAVLAIIRDAEIPLYYKFEKRS